MINAAKGIVYVVKQEGVEWVSTFPVCRVNNALGREGVPMIMMRNDRYAVAVGGALFENHRGKPHRGLHNSGGLNAAGL